AFRETDLFRIELRLQSSVRGPRRVTASARRELIQLRREAIAGRRRSIGKQRPHGRRGRGIGSRGIEDERAIVEESVAVHVAGNHRRVSLAREQSNASSYIQEVDHRKIRPGQRYRVTAALLPRRPECAEWSARRAREA